MANDNLRDLVARRGTIKGHLTQFKNYLARYEQEPDPIKLSVKKKRLVNSFDNFEEIQHGIEALDATVTQSTERETMEENYDDLITAAEKILDGRTTQVSEVRHLRASPSESTAAMSGVKLPKVDLPRFDGRVEQWLSFKDQFTSLIDNQVTLSNVQKLQYLRSAVSGEAVKVLESLDTTDDNYTYAWELLIENYANKRLMIWRHGELLLQAPPIERNSASSLRQFTNHIRQHLRCLKSLGQPVDSWDTIIIVIILPKLDRDTRMEFEKPFKADQIPTLEDLLTFLTDRARRLETADKYSRPTTSNSKPSVKSTSMEPLKSVRSKVHQTLTTTIIPCPICKSSLHRVYECEELHTVSIPERLQIVRQNNLCLNCLRRGHIAVQCRSIKCRICDQLHHTLLHTDSLDVEQERGGGTQA